MPIQSKAQWAYLAMNHPELLHRWQEEAPRTFNKLPEHKRKGKKAAAKPRTRQEEVRDAIRRHMMRTP